MPSYVRSSQSVDTTSEKATVVSFSSVSTNDLLVCYILTTDSVLATTSTVSISDNQATGGNTYSLIITSSVSSVIGDGTATCWLYYSIATKASGTFTITATGSTGLTTTGDIGLCVLEFNGINTTTPYLGLASGSYSTTSTTTASTASINSTTSNTLYVSAACILELTANALNGFTLVQSGSTTGNGLWFNASYLISSGNKQGAFTFSSNPWVMLSAAFNPSVVLTTSTGIMQTKSWWGDL